MKKRDRRWVAHLLVPLCGLAVIGFTWLGLDIQAKILGGIWMAVGIVYYVVMRFALKRDVKIEG